MAKGFAAVTKDGEILVDTVSPHDRGAMVNWLYTHGGFMVPRGMGDYAIREAFALYSEKLGATVRPVNITTIEQ